MANSNYTILSSLSAVITHEYRIFRPDGALYKTFTSDQVDGVGDASSYNTSTNFDTPPGSLSSVLSSAIEHRLIYSRQFVSWPIHVYAKIIPQGTPDSPVYRKLYTGIVGKLSIKGNQADIEIIPQYAIAKSKSKFIVSSNCTREFGSTGCSVPVNGTYLPVATQSGQQLTFTPQTVTINALLPYNVVVGDDTYSVIGTQLSSGQLIGLTLNRPMLARPDLVFFARTCNQTLQNCALYQNTNRYLGAVVESSILSITI